MSIVKTLAVVSLFLLILLSCAGIRPCVKEQRKENLRIQAEEKFDPWKIEKEDYEGSEKPMLKSGKVGRCRCHAPTMRGFPVVWSQDWCGDHKLDENRI